MNIQPNNTTVYPEQIVYEDNHLMVINKLPSEIVQADKTEDIPLTEKVKNFIKIRDKKPGNVFCGLVHRLDRPVSGLIIMAKTSKALSRLNEQLRNKQIKKYYLAVVKNKPTKTSDTLKHFLVKNEKNNLSKAYSKPVKNSLEAVLEYQLLFSSDRYHLLLINLHTGRHHQIRSQLSAIGSPIKGDLKYGFERSNKGGFIHLHSYKLEFTHPVKKETITIEAMPLITDPIWDFFRKEAFFDKKN